MLSTLIKLFSVMLLLLASCTIKSQAESHPCYGKYSCLNVWDTCRNYCVAYDGEGENRSCKEYNRDLERVCNLCDPLEGMSEKEAALYDAKHQCNDFNYKRQLRRWNAYHPPCNIEDFE